MGWYLLHSLHFSLVLHVFDRWPLRRQPKHRPLDLMNSTCCLTSCSKYFLQSSRPWLSLHNGHCDTGLAVRGSELMADEVSSAFTPRERLWDGLVFNDSLGRPLFRSFLRTLGEKIGSLAISASSLTNLTRSLNTTLPLLFCNSLAWRHHLTPAYEGSLALTAMSVSVQLSSSIY